MNKKILISLSVVVAVSAIAVGGTVAFFSDKETSVGNTFAAGAIDLKIDSHATYNGQPVTAATWELKDLNPTSDKFFNFVDIKPGDEGENTISLHVINNDAWVCAEVSGLVSAENSCNEPETQAEPNCAPDGDGELDDTMVWTVWRDPNCNDIQDSGEETLASGHPVNGVLAVYDSTTQAGPLTGGSTTCLGVAWELPLETGNEVQTDSLTGDISFEVVQSRNNTSFVCGPVQQEPARTTLGLENKDIDGTWAPYLNDGTYGTLTFISSNPTFDYTLSVYGLAVNTNYSLIYYADPWPGNNPGALIGTLLTDASGNASVSGNVELGTDLPNSADANFPGGAKIWVIRSSAYTPNSVTSWPIGAESLFENNTIIYNDTNN